LEWVDPRGQVTDRVQVVDVVSASGQEVLDFVEKMLVGSFQPLRGLENLKRPSRLEDQVRFGARSWMFRAFHQWNERMILPKPTDSLDTSYCLSYRDQAGQCVASLTQWTQSRIFFKNQTQSYYLDPQPDGRVFVFEMVGMPSAEDRKLEENGRWQERTIFGVKVIIMDAPSVLQATKEELQWLFAEQDGMVLIGRYRPSGERFSAFFSRSWTEDLARMLALYALKPE
jgi:hypothetical protein